MLTHRNKMLIGMMSPVLRTNDIYERVMTVLTPNARKSFSYNSNFKVRIGINYDSKRYCATLVDELALSMTLNFPHTLSCALLGKEVPAYIMNRELDASYERILADVIRRKKDEDNLSGIITYLDKALRTFQNRHNKAVVYGLDEHSAFYRHIDLRADTGLRSSNLFRALKESDFIQLGEVDSTFEIRPESLKDYYDGGELKACFVHISQGIDRDVCTC